MHCHAALLVLVGFCAHMADAVEGAPRLPTMKSLAALLTLTAAACTAPAPGLTSPEASAREAAFGPEPQEEALPSPEAELLAFAEPSRIHERLMALAGEWVVELVALSAPDAEPVRATFRAQFEPMLGGRYLVEELEGVLMERPYEGFMVLGHNNGTGEVFTVWFDSLGTGMGTARGTLRGDMINLTGEIDTAQYPGGAPYRTVVHLIEKDAFILEMFSLDLDGNEFRSAELRYARR